MHEIATARNLRFIQLTQEFHVILVLLSAPPVLISVRPNEDIWLTGFNDVSHFVPCRPHAKVAVRHVECSCRRNRHPVQCVVLNIRDPHRFFTVPVLWRRLFEDSSRNVLFSGARLLESCFTWFPFRCDPPSAGPTELGFDSVFVPSRLLLLARVTSGAGPALISLVTSLVPVFWSVLVVMLGRAPDDDDPPYETEGCGVES